MKKLLLVLSVILLLLTSCNKTSYNNEITVYCYDSFTGDWGPGNSLAEDFEAQTGIHVNLISCAGSVQLYSKILFEGEKCPADAVIGLPDSIKLDTSLFETWTPSCKADLIEYKGTSLIPFDYGTFAFIYNSEDTSLVPPTCLMDLAKPEYKNKFILIDPRTSTVGLGLLKWTYSCLGDEFDTWWYKVLDNALTVADSWSTAYGLFTENEAPMVISFSTSPVYHIENEGTDKYRALEFTDGHIQTYEYLAILNKSENKDKAEKFCEYVLSEGQSKIALCNTMYPANTKTELPKSYGSLINPRILKTDDEAFINNLDSIISRWTEDAIE